MRKRRVELPQNTSCRNAGVIPGDADALFVIQMMTLQRSQK